MYHLVIIKIEAILKGTGEDTHDQVETQAIVPSIDKEDIVGTQVAMIVLNAKHVRKQDI